MLLMHTGLNFFTEARLMGSNLIMVNSITYAIKGRDLLRSKGFKAYIEKTPGKLDSHGCGYSIVVNVEPSQVTGLLEKADIKVLGISTREMP